MLNPSPKPKPKNNLALLNHNLLLIFQPIQSVALGILNTLKLWLMISLITLVHSAQAHFVLDAKTRVIHLVPTSQFTIPQNSSLSPSQDGLYLALRIPAPLIYADALAKRNNPQQPVDAPYLKEEWLEGALYYHLDIETIKQQPSEFGKFVLNGYRLSTEDKQALSATIIAVNAHDNRHRPHFNALDGVLESFTSDTVIGDYYVGESVVDILVLLDTSHTNDTVSIVNILPKIPLPPTVELLNIGYDHRQQPPLTQQQSGQLEQAMIFDGKTLTSFVNYLEQGIAHILIGLDHVIFVLCLVIVSGFSRQIIWSVTGFTLGHSVTFALGAFGIYPQATWFVPLIELIIAVSIIIAALLVFVRQKQFMRSNWRLFALTAFIGLLHGYGFAFVFSELVGDVQTQLLALLGFNIGVEIGQLLIVAVALLVLFILAKINQTIALTSRYATALVAIAIACWWIIERSQILIGISQSL